jgi:hypothetical protein
MWLSLGLLCVSFGGIFRSYMREGVRNQEPAYPPETVRREIPKRIAQKTQTIRPEAHPVTPVITKIPIQPQHPFQLVHLITLIIQLQSVRLLQQTHLITLPKLPPHLPTLQPRKTPQRLPLQILAPPQLLRPTNLITQITPKA